MINGVYGGVMRYIVITILLFLNMVGGTDTDWHTLKATFTESRQAKRKTVDILSRLKYVERDLDKIRSSISVITNKFKQKPS